jgi:hypothetical protein
VLYYLIGACFISIFIFWTIIDNQNLNAKTRFLETAGLYLFIKKHLRNEAETLKIISVCWFKRLRIRKNMQCPTCEKTVYFAERVRSIGKDWHRGCLKCHQCQKVLVEGFKKIMCIILREWVLLVNLFFKVFRHGFLMNW